MRENVVHPRQWQRKPPRRHHEAVDFIRAMHHLETDLRAAGFKVAADLMAAGGLAVWQDAQEAGAPPSPRPEAG